MTDMAASDSRTPWRWLQADHADQRGPPWPPAEPAAAFADPEPFGEAGASGISILVIVGWRRGAGAWLYGDARLRSRDLLWLMRPGHLALAAAELDAVGCDTANLTVGTYREAGELAPQVRSVGLIWGLAVLDDDPGIREHLRRARIGLLRAVQFKFPRILEDLPHLAASADRVAGSLPIAAFKDRCRGRAALCIGAGPGLDDHLDRIRRLHGDCVVIACDVVAQRLESEGIRVDVVMNVDSHAEIAKRVGRPSNPRTVLVTNLGVHPDLAAAFPLVAYDGSAFGGRFVFRDPHGFPRGTNVGAATLGFAAHLGCSAIILAGHDLSFSRTRGYSRLVADAERLSAFNFAELIASGQVYEVPGNDDAPVLTDACFGLGIDELALLISHLPDTPVYNLNLSTGRGARIAGTRPLPEGWHPPGDGLELELPAPDAGNLLCTSSEVLRRTVLDAWRAWCARAEASVAGDPIAFFAACEADPALAAGWEVARHAFTGHLLQAARWAAQPAHQARHGARAAILPSLVEAIPAVTAVVEAAIAGSRLPPRIPVPDPSWAACHAEFVRLLPVLSADTFTGAAAQVAAGQFAALIAAVPGGVPLPPPLSVHDAVLRLAASGEALGGAAVDEVAACCWMESEMAGYLVDVLRRHGRIAPGALTDPDVEWGGTPAMRAARALARLPMAPSAVVPELARTAAAWVPCHHVLLRRLLAHPAGPPVACRLVGDGDLPVDDGLAAELLAGHPETLAAIAALEPYQDRLGAATTVAIARHHLALGEFAQAERHAARVPALDALAEEALGVRLAAALALGGAQAMVDAAVVFPRPALRIAGIFRAIRHLSGEAAAWGFLVEHRLLPVPPRLIALALRDLATGAWRPADRTAAAHMLGTIAEASLMAGAPEEWLADLRTVASAAAALPLEDAAAKDG